MYNVVFLWSICCNTTVQAFILVLLVLKKHKPMYLENMDAQTKPTLQKNENGIGYISCFGRIQISVSQTNKNTTVSSFWYKGERCRCSEKDYFRRPIKFRDQVL